MNPNIPQNERGEKLPTEHPQHQTTTRVTRHASRAAARLAMQLEVSVGLGRSRSVSGLDPKEFA